MSLHDHGDRAIAVTALKAAIPYIRMFKRRTFVVKAGGAVFADDASTRALVEQLGICLLYTSDAADDN